MKQFTRGYIPLLSVLLSFSLAYGMDQLSVSSPTTKNTEMAHLQKLLKPKLSKGYLTNQDLLNEHNELIPQELPFADLQAFLETSSSQTNKRYNKMLRKYTIKKAINAISQESKQILQHETNTSGAERIILTDSGKKLLDDIITIGSSIEKCDELDVLNLQKLEDGSGLDTLKKMLKVKRKITEQLDEKRDLLRGSIAKIELLTLGFTFPITANSLWAMVWKQDNPLKLFNPKIVDKFASDAHSSDEDRAYLIEQIRKQLTPEDLEQLFSTLPTSDEESSASDEESSEVDSSDIKQDLDKARPSLLILFTKEELKKIWGEIEKKIKNTHTMIKMLKDSTEPQQKTLTASHWTWINPFTWPPLKKIQCFFLLALIVGAEVITHINTRQ
jgi:hypothetical protein